MLINRIIEKFYLWQKSNLAYHDILTGCFNRNYYEREIRTKKKNEDCTIGLCDLDNLKRMNDKMGHFEGDKKVVELANFLKSYGTVARLGGDEFLLIADAQKFDNFEKDALALGTFCFGICHKNANDNFGEAMALADKKMYKMKKKRRENEKLEVSKNKK